jgi:hypothetical protein
MTHGANPMVAMMAAVHVVAVDAMVDLPLVDLPLVGLSLVGLSLVGSILGEARSGRQRQAGGGEQPDDDLVHWGFLARRTREVPPTRTGAPRMPQRPLAEREKLEA